MKKTIWWIIGVVIVIIVLLSWAKILQRNDPNIVARNGLHWHSTLTIYVDGKQQEVPANIGLAGDHRPIHTHTEDATKGVVHLEFDGIVRPDDLRLGNFFRNWGKDITTAFGTLERMTVNGESNTEYDTYTIQESDHIELYYSSDTRAQ